MTEREDDRSDKLVTEPASDVEWEPVQWEPEDTWPPGQHWAPGDEWPDYDDASWPDDDDASWPAASAAPPWYRRPGVLVGLIIAAMVALVIASVVLLTNARFGETDEVRLRPTIHTSAVTLPSAAERTAARTPATSATSTEPARSSTPSEEAGPIGGPAPQAPAEPRPGGGAVGDQRQTPAAPEGPRTNVTRNPMSFTPGGR